MYELFPDFLTLSKNKHLYISFHLKFIKLKRNTTSVGWFWSLNWLARNEWCIFCQSHINGLSFACSFHLPRKFTLKIEIKSSKPYLYFILDIVNYGNGPLVGTRSQFLSKFPKFYTDMLAIMVVSISINFGQFVFLTNPLDFFSLWSPIENDFFPLDHPLQN